MKIRLFIYIIFFKILLCQTSSLAMYGFGEYIDSYDASSIALGDINLFTSSKQGLVLASPSSFSKIDYSNLSMTVGFNNLDSKGFDNFSSNNFSLFSFIFPINKNMSFALGMNPVLRSDLFVEQKNYSYIGANESDFDYNNDGLNDPLAYKTNYDILGGISEFKISLSNQFNENFAVGLKIGRLFGTNSKDYVVNYFVPIFNDDGSLKWVYTYREMIPLVSKDMEALEEKLKGISEEFDYLRKNTNKSKEDEKEALFDVNKVRNLILNSKKKQMEEEAQAEKEKFQKILMYNLQKAKKEKEIIAQTKQDIKDNLEGTLTILSGHSEKAFKILKAHKIAEAIVNTYSAVMKAFATVPYPLNFLAAGSALAFGMAQVQQIRAQKFTARRQGGIVSENKPYMVGEGGPETFIPNSAGTIVPGGVGGQNVNVNFTINAVDTTGFQQLLANERAMIVGMVNSAVNQQGKSNII